MNTAEFHCRRVLQSLQAAAADGVAITWSNYWQDDRALLRIDFRSTDDQTHIQLGRGGLIEWDRMPRMPVSTDNDDELGD